MDVRPTWTDFDEAGYYVVPNVLSARDLVSRPDNMDETVPHAKVAPHKIELSLAEHFQRRCFKIMVIYMYIASGQEQTHHEKSENFHFYSREKL